MVLSRVEKRDLTGAVKAVLEPWLGVSERVDCIVLQICTCLKLASAKAKQELDLIVDWLRSIPTNLAALSIADGLERAVLHHT